MVILDACVRLLPGVMGAASSGEEESFETGLLEYPHYTRPVDMGRAHDPRSAAIGGSCEDRGVATRTRGRRYTAKAAGPDRAPRGRSQAPPSGARRRDMKARRNEPDRDARARSHRRADRRQARSRIPPRRHAARRRQGHRRRAHPRPEFRRRVHRPRQQGRRLAASPSARSASAKASSASSRSIRRSSTRSRSCAAATFAVPSSITCVAAPVRPRASPSAATVHRDDGGGQAAEKAPEA